MSRNKAIAEGLQEIIQRAIKGIKGDVKRAKSLFKAVDPEDSVKSLTPEQVKIAEQAARSLEADPSVFKAGIIDITDIEVNNKVANLSETLSSSYINEGRFTPKMKSKLKPLFSEMEINKIEAEGKDFWKQRKLKPSISKRMKLHRMNEVNADLYSDVSTMYGDGIKKIDIELDSIPNNPKLEKDPLKIATERAKRLFNKRAAAKNIMIGEGEAARGPLTTLWKKTIPTLKTKLNQLKRMADERGWSEVSERVSGTHKFMESVDGLNARTNNMFKSAAKKWGQFDDATQRKMMQLPYHQIFRKFH